MSVYSMEKKVDCQAATHPQARYPRPSVYGPLTMSPSTPDEEWAAQDVKNTASFVLEPAKSGDLAGLTPVNGNFVGLVAYFVALAEAICRTGEGFRSGGATRVFYPIHP